MVSASEEMIDESWEDIQTIMAGIADEPLEEYDEFGDASEVVNYLENELRVTEKDIDRVLEEYENAKCHICEEEHLYALSGDLDEQSIDPTLAKNQWTTEQEAYKKEEDVKHVGHFLAYCPKHEEVYLLLEESWYE